MRIIIIEGGLAGLWLAYCLQKRGCQVTVFHQQRNIMTSFFSARFGSYVQELGTPFILSAHERLLETCRELKLNNFLHSVSPSFGLLADGKFYQLSFPWQAPLRLKISWLRLLCLKPISRKKERDDSLLLAPLFFEKEIRREWVLSFFQKPHLVLRYGMDTFVERLIAQGNFFLECAVVRFQKDEERKTIKRIFVRSPFSDRHYQAQADLFVVGSPHSFPFIVACALAEKKPPADHLFVQSNQTVEGCITMLNTYFPHWQQEQFVLRFVVCTQDREQALERLTHWSRALDLGQLTNLQVAPFPTAPPSLPIQERYRNALVLPQAIHPELEIENANALKAEILSSS